VIWPRAGPAAAPSERGADGKVNVVADASLLRTLSPTELSAVTA